MLRVRPWNQAQLLCFNSRHRVVTTSTLRGMTTQTLAVADASSYPELVKELNGDTKFYPTGETDTLLGNNLKVWSNGVVSSSQCFPVDLNAEDLTDMQSVVEIGKTATDVMWMSESDADMYPFLFQGTDDKDTVNGPLSTQQIFDDVLRINQKANLAGASSEPLPTCEDAHELLSRRTDEGPEAAKRIADTLFQHLNGVTHMQVGSEVFNPTIVLLAGRTKHGNIGGLITTAVET